MTFSEKMRNVFSLTYFLENYFWMLYVVASPAFSALQLFFSEHVFSSPKPLYAIFKGFRGTQNPYDTDVEVYEYIYSSQAEADLANKILFFSIVLASICVLIILLINAALHIFFLDSFFEKAENLLGYGVFYWIFRIIMILPYWTCVYLLWAFCEFLDKNNLVLFAL